MVIGKIKKFTVWKTECGPRCFEKSLFATESSAESQCLVCKGMNVGDFFFRENVRQWGVLVNVFVKTLNLFTIYATADEWVVRFRSER